MSFIFEDKNLLNTFIKLAADDLLMPRVTPEILSGYEAASKLLYKLQSDLGDETAPKAGAPIGSQSPLSPEESQLKVADLRTLGDFINWLADKKITWEGKRIAWSFQEKSDNPNDPDIAKAWVFSSLSYDRNQRDLDRSPITKEAYANKDGLLAYLGYLRDSQEAKENNVFKLMIGTLIGEANGFLRIKGETPISTRAEKPAPAGAFDPKLIIDVIPELLDPDNPLVGIDAHPFVGNKNENNWLQYSDIATPAAFASWLRGRKVKVKKGMNTAVAGALDTDGDPCAAVYVLYKRANQLNNVAGSGADDKLVPNYGKVVAEYLKSVQTYGATFKGADGKACPVTTFTGLAGQQAPGQQAPGQQAPGGQTPGQQAPGQASGRPGVATEGPRAGLDQRTIDLIQEISAKMPLDASGVSFDKIGAFCTAIQEFNYSPWSQAANQISDNIRKAQSTLSTSKPTNLREGINLTTQWSRTPKGDYIIPFANSFDDVGMFCHYMKFVEQIVDTTASLIASFREKYKGKLLPMEYSVVTSQVGSGVSSSGTIWYYNKRAISNYLTQGSCYI